MKGTFIFKAFLLFALGYLSTLTSLAQNDSVQTIELNGQSYVLHKVVKGNTLYSLSRQYDVSVDDIVKENPSSKSGLSLGQTLRIPLPDKKEEEKRKIELDGNYLVHEITAQQTLYAISKMYNVDIKDIVAENPRVIYGIKEGDLLKIPIDKIKKSDVRLIDVTKDRYPDHKVLEGETLYSISKKYEVAIQDIERVNDGLPEGLKEGQWINIPIDNSDSYQSDNEYSDSLKLKAEYHIALFLPLFIEINDSLEDVRRPDQDDELYGGKNTAASIKFYQGLVMALDSVGKSGFHATLHVFDTKNDSVVVNRQIRKPAFKDMDLIIGPLYPNLFELVLKAASKNDIRIVSPINPSNRPLLGNIELIKMVASKTTQTTDLAKYLANNYRKQNIVVLKKDFMDNSLADSFLEHYVDHLKMIDDTAFISPAREFSCNSSTTASNLQSMMVKDTQNIVFLPSTDKVFVSDVIRKLNVLSKNYRITLIGMEEWLKFDNIDPDYFKHLNLHVITWNYIDFENEKTLAAARKYYKRYKSFPSEFGLKGFDIGMYFFPLMKKYGNSFPEFLEKYPAEQSAHSFRFCQTGIESGFENQSLVILKFNDYKLERVY